MFYYFTIKIIILTSFRNKSDNTEGYMIKHESSFSLIPPGAPTHPCRTVLLEVSPRNSAAWEASGLCMYFQGYA